MQKRFCLSGLLVIFATALFPFSSQGVTVDDFSTNQASLSDPPGGASSAFGNILNAPAAVLSAAQIGMATGSTAMQEKGCCKVMYFTTGAKIGGPITLN